MFQTDSQYVLMTSGTGHAGMEACISNLVEPGEKVVVGNNGIWGARVCDLAARFRGENCTGGLWSCSLSICGIVGRHCTSPCGWLPSEYPSSTRASQWGW